ncbi:MAG: cytochrome c oxidase subunit 3 family protein [Myxococcota bacterium]
MSVEATGHHGHFATASEERRAARLGMWLFLASEVLLFAGLFTGYATYRYLYPQTFEAGAGHLDVTLGTVNTLVLITSSFTVACGVEMARRAHGKLVALFLGASIALGLCFLVIKGFEYAHHFHSGALPGRYFQLEGFALPGASMFFTLYFMLTGLHGIHVLIGLGALCWLSVRAFRGHFSARYHTPVELGGMYWHLVDLVWIFLYPLLYLV